MEIKAQDYSYIEAGSDGTLPGEEVNEKTEANEEDEFEFIKPKPGFVFT